MENGTQPSRTEMQDMEVTPRFNVTLFFTLGSVVIKTLHSACQVFVRNRTVTCAS
jgi:hypothetical protein